MMIDTKKFPDSAYIRSSEFLGTQFLFAQKASEILGITPKESLLKYTELCFLLKVEGLNKKMDTALMELLSVNEQLGVISKELIAFIGHYKTGENHIRKNVCGSMGVDLDERNRTVQWHTLPYPVDADKPSIFQKSEVPERRRELGEITRFVYDQYRDKVDTILSYSWLFNLDAATRFFPENFIKGGKIVRRGYKGLATWGQFLDKSYKPKTDLVNKFRSNVANAKSKDSLFNAFPYGTILLESPMQVFYDEFMMGESFRVTAEI